MLYIFDLDNVILDIDFKRTLGVWHHLSGVPLATLEQHFRINESFELHERGTITDQQFAQLICTELSLSLSFEQFSLGWQAMFVGIRPEMIDLMHKQRQQGDRVVILANTNQLHYQYWSNHYPQITATVDRLYLSQQLGIRKPDVQIYYEVLQQENMLPQQAIFFDDQKDNIATAQAIGIDSIWVTDRQAVPAYFSQAERSY